ncbi:MAG: ABC transporter ATP-binding protein [Thermomicrobiales bacterium]|nr:ABC transporter ATP-binding protein [Thermomicrobiales bacterium]
MAVASHTTTPPNPATGVESVLSVRHLTTEFATRAGAFTAVHDLSFDVTKGECLGIVGESGSGKSVASLSVMGLIDYPGRITRGEIVFQGRDLRRVSPRDLRKLRGSQMSIIFQDPQTSLNPLFTIGQQMVDVVRAHRSVSRDEARELAIAKLRLVGMSAPETRMRAYPWELSGGLRQRVAIALALMLDPVLVIADEPTTALDVSIQAQIIELLRSLKVELGFSLIFISHDLGVISNIADRVLVMYAGRAVEEGVTRATFARPTHPYTAALLGSAPTLASDRSRALPAIEGGLPQLHDRLTGCVFAPRCAFVRDRCHQSEPPFAPVDALSNRLAACYFPLNTGAADRGGEA